jgi:prepilin-type N-terminal cleavage/methylation domain-containing protein
MQAERQRSAGFTLLEVLAAVAVLGLVYSVLATAAIQGLRAEGDAGRRLRASLLADQRITDIEAQVALGQTPEIGETEVEEDEFVVRTVVEPLDLDVGDTKASKRAKERLDRAVGARPKAAKGETGKGETGKGEAGTLLHPAGASKQPLLRRIDLRVAWADGEAEQSVRRTSFGLDMVAAAPLIEQLVAAAEAEEAKTAQQSQEKAQAAASKNGRQPLKSDSSSSASSSGATRAPTQQPRSSTPMGTDPNGHGGDDR